MLGGRDVGEGVMEGEYFEPGEGGKGSDSGPGGG